MATTSNQAVQRATDQNQGTKLHPYLVNGNFEIQIIFEGTTVVHNEPQLLPDLLASITAWNFTPFEATDNLEHFEDDEEDDEDDESFDDSTDLRFDESDEDEEDLDDDVEMEDGDDDLLIVGTLTLTHLVNRDTIVQRALVSESLAITVKVTIKDESGTAGVRHSFTGTVNEKLLPLGGVAHSTDSLTDHLILDVVDLALWEPV